MHIRSGKAKRRYFLAIVAVTVTVSVILPEVGWRQDDTVLADSGAVYSVERRSYTVQYGDTLWDIAERFMGDGMGYHIIVYENNFADPDLIFPNDVLVVPIIHRGR